MVLEHTTPQTQAEQYQLSFEEARATAAELWDWKRQLVKSEERIGEIDAAFKVSEAGLERAEEVEKAKRLKELIKGEQWRFVEGVKNAAR